MLQGALAGAAHFPPPRGRDLRLASGDGVLWGRLPETRLRGGGERSGVPARLLPPRPGSYTERQGGRAGRGASLHPGRSGVIF